MNVKKATVINILLFIAATVCFFIGLYLVREAETDLDKIGVTVTGKTSSYDQTDYHDPYNVTLKFELDNGTKADWGRIEIVTAVKTKEGKLIGNINTTFGFYGSNSDFELKKGEKKSLKSTLKFGEYTPDHDGFLITLYKTPYEDLVFTPEIRSGSYFN